MIAVGDSAAPCKSDKVPLSVHRQLGIPQGTLVSASAKVPVNAAAVSTLFRVSERTRLQQALFASAVVSSNPVMVIISKLPV